MPRTMTADRRTARAGNRKLLRGQVLRFDPNRPKAEVRTPPAFPIAVLSHPVLMKLARAILCEELHVKRPYAVKALEVFLDDMLADIARGA